MSMAKRYAAVFAGAVLATVGIGAVPASAGTLADRSSTLPDPPAVVMVRALAGLPGTGSILCYYNSTLQSHANGLLVSMRVEEGGRLRAMTAPNAAGDWERFLVCYKTGSGATYIYSFVAQRYVTVRLDQGGIVSATGVAPRGWELFYTSGNPDPANSPDTTVLHANANNSYVSVRIEDGGRMRTGIKQIGNWEVFTW